MHYGQGSAIPLLAQSAVLLDDKLQAQIRGLDHNALENHEKNFLRANNYQCLIQPYTSYFIIIM